MNIDISLTREDDKRLKATARTEADEYGSQLEVTVWSDATPQDPAKIANLVGRAVIKAGLAIPKVPAAEDPAFKLQLGPVEPPPPPRAKERRVVLGGDTEGMRALVSEAILQERELRIEYIDGQDNTTTRTVTPIGLDWASSGRTLRLIDRGTPKTFYVERIQMAEIV